MQVMLKNIEEAINRCKAEEPFDGCVLPPALRRLSDIYGTMIYLHVDTLDISSFPEETINTAKHWVIA